MGLSQTLFRFPFFYQRCVPYRLTAFAISPAYSLRLKFFSTNKRTPRAAEHPPLNSFFSVFPSFHRNTSNSPEADFRLLQSAQDWIKPAYVLHRRAFLVALTNETNSPIHTFFTGYTDFLEYDSTTSPHNAFNRLKSHYNWPHNDPVCLEAHEEFMSFFHREFSAPLDIFYHDFPSFKYNPRAAPMSEFRRLMSHKGWRRKPADQDQDDDKSRKYRSAKNDFFAAFREEFGMHFGGDGDVGDIGDDDDGDIKTWKQLCETLGVVPLPEDKKTCKKVLRPFMVNIYDLVYHKRTGAGFDFFSSLKDLRRYTIKKKLMFPKDTAKRGPLEFLLREILVRRHMALGLSKVVRNSKRPSADNVGNK